MIGLQFSQILEFELGGGKNGFFARFSSDTSVGFVSQSQFITWVCCSMEASLIPAGREASRSLSSSVMVSSSSPICSVD